MKLLLSYITCSITFFFSFSQEQINITFGCSFPLSEFSGKINTRLNIQL